MPNVITDRKTTTATRTERPRLYKVILLNDDFTPREFVVQVLRRVFRMTEAESDVVMMTAHQRGREHGYPLAFTSEKEE